MGVLLKNIPLSEPPSRFLGRCESHCRETAHLICLAKFSPSFSARLPLPLYPRPPFSDPSTISLRDLLFPSPSPFPLSLFPDSSEKMAGSHEEARSEEEGRNEGASRGAERRKGFDVRGGGEGGEKRPRGSLLGGGRKVCLKY